MTLFQTVAIIIMIIVVFVIIYGLGYSHGQDSAVKYYNNFLNHLNEIVKSENWSSDEIFEKIDDFKSGRNPSNSCVAKECCPMDSIDCVDCGYNAESKRKIKEVNPNE